MHTAMTSVCLTFGALLMTAIVVQTLLHRRPVKRPARSSRRLARGDPPASH